MRRDEQVIRLAYQRKELAQWSEGQGPDTSTTRDWADHADLADTDSVAGHHDHSTEEEGHRQHGKHEQPHDQHRRTTSANTSPNQRI